jgi:hypothetical protein
MFSAGRVTLPSTSQRRNIPNEPISVPKCFNLNLPGGLYFHHAYSKPFGGDIPESVLLDEK